MSGHFRCLLLFTHSSRAPSGLLLLPSRRSLTFILFEYFAKTNEQHEDDHGKKHCDSDNLYHTIWIDWLQMTVQK